MVLDVCKENYKPSCRSVWPFPNIYLYFLTHENVYFIKHVFVYLVVYCKVFNKAKIHDDVLVFSCLKDRNEMVCFKVCGPFERVSEWLYKLKWVRAALL